MMPSKYTDTILRNAIERCCYKYDPISECMNVFDYGNTEIRMQFAIYCVIAFEFTFAYEAEHINRMCAFMFRQAIFWFLPETNSFWQQNEKINKQELRLVCEWR